MSLLAIAASSAVVAAQGNTLPSYRVDFLGNATSAAAINEWGAVVGWITLPSGITRAAISHDGELMSQLPLPAGYQSSHAYDINDSGLVVGVVSPYTVASIQPHAAAWYPSPNGYSVQLLGEPAGDLYGNATGVNNLGDIVGSSGTTPWSYFIHGVHYTASGPVVLPVFDGAVDVNDNRNVLSTRSELLDLDTMQIQSIPLPPGNWMGFGGAALNELDDFAGYIQGYSSTCASFPMRHRASDGWLTIGGCAQTTSASAINDRGDVLHYVNPTAARVRFEGLGDYPIGQLLDPSAGTWYVQYWGASDINNKRQMLAGVRDVTLTLSGAARLTDVNACGAASVETYCTAKTTTSGCVPTITTSGDASASAASGFQVRASQIEAQRIGMFFYGTSGAAASPFRGGFMCVHAPVRRLATQDSGGTVTCSGSFVYDFNAWIATGLDPALVSGATVNGQFWFRDPPATGTVGLSAGVQFVVCD